MFKTITLDDVARLKNIPIALLLVITLLLSCGLLIMKSASIEGSNSIYFKKQLIYAAIFFFVMISITLVDIKLIFNSAYILYAISLILLLSVTLIGHTAMGATRWLNLGFIKMQPSEIMKLTMVITLARYFHFKTAEEVKNIKHLIIPAILVILPTAIIIKQPDLGTAITLLCTFIIIFFLSGVRIWKFLASSAMVIAACPIIWKYLHNYQKKRILIFLNPESDPLGSGYNIIQSKIAIGSGGLWGKGMLGSTQAHLDFLPEHRTDFVFSLFAEGFGFIGSLLLIGLFLILIFLSINLALKCRHQFGKLLIFGLTSVFSVNMLTNLGMVSGLLPVVGIPLPFLSYGGSSLATTLILFGIIMNIAINYNAILPNNQ
ncbi:MAG: rod shape-determining protein RodA [Rickettsiales bacterium]|nr:rod shape-determining protein RodA [Rickettsiales bacterium]